MIRARHRPPIALSVLSHGCVLPSPAFETGLLVPDMDPLVVGRLGEIPGARDKLSEDALVIVESVDVCRLGDMEPVRVHELATARRTLSGRRGSRRNARRSYSCCSTGGKSGYRRPTRCW